MTEKDSLRERRDDEEFASLPIRGEEKERILSAMIRMPGMGMAAVYGDEDENIPDTEVDCRRKHERCRSRCCTLTFALTKAEVERGIIQYNPERPFFIARGEDGYCVHLDRESLCCEERHDRPLRCRRYECTGDPHIWSGKERSEE